MEMITNLLAVVVRFLMTIKIADILDITIMAYLVYQLLKLVKSTKAASLLKGLLVFLMALWLSTIFKLNGINFILNRMMELGILALIILFQPEIRRILEQVGSSRFAGFGLFSKEQKAGTMEHAIGQTVLACTEMSKSRTGVLIVFEREILLDVLFRR